MPSRPDDSTPLPIDRHRLIRTSAARQTGQQAQLNRAVRAGEVQRVRRGVYAPVGADPPLRGADHHLLTAFAAAAQREDPVFAGYTAALLHGMPAVGAIPAQVTVLAGGASGRIRNGVIELGRRADTVVESHGGVRLTSLAEAVLEVGRRSPLVTALAMVDAAIGPRLDGDPRPDCTLDELVAILERRRPFRGSPRIAAVLARADPLAESPLESLSRLRFEEYGFPPPRSQHEVRLTDGRTARLDFAWPGLGVWGEADGMGKYGSGGARTAATLIEEKRRENAIRAITGWRCVRWGWRDAWLGVPLARLLLDAGLPASGRARRR
ncbi:type IV toxin-antitoxin system AbiEi family antitoxin domain-containing protein [Agromyces soli]|uniref:Type IV toxin-antitoxin system AbiEi family antitoxin domain-containing protein n=1 Tax=Agromyces soli TaxID=659012 RepID=A0ABY4AVS9_9MICO|nr:type IV toxin-antitoxin system AbiEi family antitoxin domain-containing protein [Agromyces soli]UOE25926.1 type IV toxin-antitoxin system AbiEi family antitoxin domain-containing protein [Agromyces soli]